MNEIYFAEISDRADSAVMQQFMSVISIQRQQQIRSMRFEIDRKLRLYSEALLRSRLCSLLSIQNKEIHFAVNEFGKPYLPDFPGIHFNISHTRNALIMGIGDKNVGVDIERINKADQSVAQKVFTDHEVAYIYAENDQIDKRFAEIWTRKEAYAKWTGTGWSSAVQGEDVLCGINAFRIAARQMDKYMVSVCSDSADTYSDVIRNTEEQLYSITHNLILPQG